MENPSLDRQAETILKLEEDLLGFPTYPVFRTARVVAGEPFRVSEMLASGELPEKNGAIKLTDMMEERLGGMLAG